MCGRDLLVGLEPQPLAGDVVVRQVRVDGKVDLDLGDLVRRLALELRHRLPDEPHIKVEADRRNVPGLLATEQVAGAPDLQVLHRHLHAGTEVGVLGDRGKPIVRLLGERAVRRIEEVRIGAVSAAADATAELMQLGQAEQIAALDDQRVGVGNVETVLDDGRADQHIELSFPEPEHDAFELMLVHLAVCRQHARFRHDVAQPRGSALDGLDPVVNVEDLTVAQQLAADRSRDLLLVISAYESQHRMPLFRRRLDDAHLPDAGDGHLQGPRDRRRRHREHID